MAANPAGALTRWMGPALVLAAVSALVGVLVRGDVGLVLDSASLLLLGTFPALRVVVLAVRWSRSGDRKYANAAVALLLLMAVGVIVVSVWG